MPCLIMCPSLVTFSTLSYFPASLFHLPSEFLASESLSQDLTSEEPKLSHYLGIIQYTLSPPVALVVKNLPASAADTRDLGSTPGLGRSPGEGNGNPLHRSCLENPMGRGAWGATVHGVARVGHDLATKEKIILFFLFIKIYTILSENKEQGKWRRKQA